MPTLRFPFHLANHNKDAAINILIIFISIGSIIFNVNYFHTTIVKNGQIINQPTNAFQSDFSLAALWRNENHAGVKDANPGNDSNLLIVFYVQIMPDDFVMQLHRF